uniref:Clathrin light chain n=2 Tax=Denticeps clupeoides TaxID=299321 RepID=A0AAY4AW71_9TELE
MTSSHQDSANSVGHQRSTQITGLACGPFNHLIGHCACQSKSASAHWLLPSFPLYASSPALPRLSWPRRAGRLSSEEISVPYVTLRQNMDDFDMLSAPQSSAGNGLGSDEDPAAAFLAQQESEIAGIENDEGFSILDGGDVPSSLSSNLTGEQDAGSAAFNGEIHQESNGPSDAYAAISNADRLQAEPESLRKWREEQRTRLEALDANSRKQEVEWKEKAKVELEEWHTRQDEQLEKTKANNRVLDEDFYKQPFSELIGYVAAEEAMVSELDENKPGSEWERVARLCDFNPKSNKQAKDVSRMRSVLISLKQSPLVR